MKRERKAKGSIMVMAVLNLDKALFDYTTGKPMVEPVYDFVKGGEPKLIDKKEITARAIAIRAMMNGLPGDNELGDEARAKNFTLGVKLTKEGPVYLSSDEIVLLKSRIRKGYPSAQTSEQMAELLDNAKAAPEEDPE